MFHTYIKLRVSFGKQFAALDSPYFWPYFVANSSLGRSIRRYVPAWVWRKDFGSHLCYVSVRNTVLLTQLQDKSTIWTRSIILGRKSFERRKSINFINLTDFPVSFPVGALTPLSACGFHRFHLPRGGHPRPQPFQHILALLATQAVWALQGRHLRTCDTLCVFFGVHYKDQWPGDTFTGAYSSLLAFGQSQKIGALSFVICIAKFSIWKHSWKKRRIREDGGRWAKSDEVKSFGVAELRLLECCLNFGCRSKCKRLSE